MDQEQPTQPTHTAPAYTAPMPITPSAPEVGTKEEDPGLALGVAAMAFIFSGLQLVGIILAIIGMKRSKAAGYSGSVSRMALILNIIIAVLAIVAIVLYVILIAVFSSMSSQSY